MIGVYHKDLFGGHSEQTNSRSKGTGAGSWLCSGYIRTRAALADVSKQRK